MVANNVKVSKVVVMAKNQMELTSFSVRFFCKALFLEQKENELSNM